MRPIATAAALLVVLLSGCGAPGGRYPSAGPYGSSILYPYGDPYGRYDPYDPYGRYDPYRDPYRRYPDSYGYPGIYGSWGDYDERDRRTRREREHGRVHRGMREEHREDHRDLQREHSEAHRKPMTREQHRDLHRGMKSEHREDHRDLQHGHEHAHDDLEEGRSPSRHRH